MRQPSVFDREQIIDAGLEVIRRSGYERLTARAVAGRLGASTMPIYTNIGSIDELRVAVRRRAHEVLRSFQQKPYTGERLLDLAFGYVAFARDEPQLFRFLFLGARGAGERPSTDSLRERFFGEFGEQGEEAGALSGLRAEAQERVIHHAWIFTHGLAMLVSSGNYPADDEEILRRLRIAGGAFYSYEGGFE